MIKDEGFYRQELAANEAKYGTGHPEVAKTLNNLAVLLSKQSRYEEAEPLHRRSLAITEATYGPGHPVAAVTLTNLASVLRELSRHEEAEPIYRRSLAMFEATLGPDHPRVAVTLAYLADALKELSRHEEAEPLYRRSLAISVAAHGPDHPQVAALLNELAELESARSLPPETQQMGGLTLFDQDMNFVLLGIEFSDDGRVGLGTDMVYISHRKGVLSEVDMQPHKTSLDSRLAEQFRLLDNLMIYAKSPQDYFEIMTTCASLDNQPKYVNGEPALEPWGILFEDKHRFFTSVGGQRAYSSCEDISVAIAGGPVFTLADLCLAFNPASLALLSFPAFLVLASDSAFFMAPGNQPVPIGRWTYDRNFPGARINDFDDYCRLFCHGGFVRNNSDLFLTTYGLAHAIVTFAEDIKNFEFFESATSFRDYFTYEPLLYVLEKLIAIGALRDPWGPPVWKICPTGIENARQVNPDLAAALHLTDSLAPIMTTPGAPHHAILQAFYGLIDVLPLREYFCIDRRVKFEYPAI